MCSAFLGKEQRGAGQIRDELELHSIALGFCSSAKRVAGRNTVIWSGNTRAEEPTQKGATKSFERLCWAFLVATFSGTAHGCVGYACAH